MFYVLPILATTVRACAAVANKNEKFSAWLRRSVSCAKGVLMPLPHAVFSDFLCAFFASHCRSPHSIWKSLFSFTINFAEI